MHHLIIKYGLLLLLVCQSARIFGLTVVSWNIEFFPGKKLHPSLVEMKEQMESAQKVIQKLNPDLFIGLEMRDWSSFQELISVVPDMKVNVVSAFRDLDTGEIAKQQIGIASRLRVHSAWAEAWKPEVEELPRGFSFVALEAPNHKGLLMVYGLHLKSNRGQLNDEDNSNIIVRNKSVHQLIAHMQEMEQLYGVSNINGWIIAGDFNTNHDNQFKGDEVIKSFTDIEFWNSWNDVPREKRLTWRGNEFFDGTTFDYILLKKLGKPSAQMGIAPLETSDHHPVIINLTLPQDNASESSTKKSESKRDKEKAH